MKTEKKQKAKVAKQKFSWQLMWKQRYLLLMSVPFVIWLIIFKFRCGDGQWRFRR